MFKLIRALIRKMRKANVTCISCKHKHIDANEQPCINCTHNAVDHYEPI